MSLCGPLRARFAQRDVSESLPGRQGRLLFAYLVANRHRSVSRDELLDILWPDSPPATAEASLRALLSKVRAAVAPAVVAGRNELRIELPEGALVDLEEAQSGLSEASAALAREDFEAARSAGEHAMGILEGGFLTGIECEWTQHERAALEEQRVEALELVARACVRAGEAGMAERVTRALVKAAPYRESGYVLLMRALERLGNAAEAIRVYDELRRLLRDELGAMPGPEAQYLIQRLLEQTGSESRTAPPPADAAPAPMLAPAPSPAQRLQRSPSSSPALLERESEMARIDAALASAAEGRGALVYIEGPPGIGKTSLIAQAVEDARSAGWRAATARGSELETDIGFGVAVQLLSPLVRSYGARLFDGAAGLSRGLFETGIGEDVAPTAPGLLHGLFWVAANAAEEGPLLLAVDDAHWADESSLRLLLYLAQRIEELPIAVVVGSRRDSSNVSLLRLSTRVEGRITPRALSSAATSELVRRWGLADADDAFVDACHAASGGNPFLLHELVAALVATAVAPVRENARHVLEVGPVSVRRAVRLRLAALPPQATALVRAVAVLGDGVTLDLAAELAQLTPADARAAADALVDVELLESVDPFSFTHPVIRNALYTELHDGERANAHIAAAALKHRRGAPAERIAAHLLSAPPVGEAWAASALIEAGGLAMARGQPESAVRCFARARQEPVANAERAQLELALGTAQGACGEPASVDTLARAVELAAGETDEASILLTLGRTLFAFGHHHEAGEAFRRGLETLGGTDPRLERRLRAAHFAASYLDPSVDPLPEALVARYLQLERPLFEERLAIAQLALIAVARIRPARTAISLARRAWGDGALLADESSEGATWPLMIWVLRTADDLPSAESALTAAFDYARSEGSVLGFGSALFNRATLETLEGRLAEARTDLEQALQMGPGGPYPLATKALLALVHIEDGRPDAAEAVLDTIAVSDTPTGETSYIKYASGRLLLRRGDAQGALRDLLAIRPLSERGLSLPTPNPGSLPWRSWACIAAARAGEYELGRELLDEELALAQRFGAARSLGIALHAKALLERRDGGVEVLQEAVAVLEQSPSRLELIRTLIDLGAMLRAHGYAAEAREGLRRALDLAHRQGAAALASRANSELLAAGGRPRRQAASGCESLTPSERRVAEKAVSGLSNREIAEDLFVTVKAVKWHLTNAYRKLGVSSRNELTRALDLVA